LIFAQEVAAKIRILCFYKVDFCTRISSKNLKGLEPHYFFLHVSDLHDDYAITNRQWQIEIFRMIPLPFITFENAG